HRARATENGYHESRYGRFLVADERKRPLTVFLRQPDGPAMRVRATALALLCGLLVLHALHFFKPVDDAFISFRYAANLAGGRGLVFNEGERVEGYTDFLWVVLLAACRFLGADIAAASQALGLLFSLACLITAAWVARK